MSLVVNATVVDVAERWLANFGRASVVVGDVRTAIKIANAQTLGDVDKRQWGEFRQFAQDGARRREIKLDSADGAAWIERVVDQTREIGDSDEAVLQVLSAIPNPSRSNKRRRQALTNALFARSISSTESSQP